MRVLVFFDLPTETAAERRQYRVFRRMLIKSGFMMLQESVYCAMVLNATAREALIEHVRRNRPKSGLVQVLTVTEKQFATIECIAGEYHSDVLDTDERLVFL